MKTPWLFIIAFALVFYANGAAFIESFVNYPSWRFIGPKEFSGYHQFIGPRVVIYLVVPALLASIFTLVMLWRRPVAIPLWAVWVAVVFQIIIWVSSAHIQIPIQVEFSSAGFSEERLASLITSNFWLRRVPNALTAALFLWMMHRVITMTHLREAAPTAH
jgi:hypothetical protein